MSTNEGFLNAGSLSPPGAIGRSVRVMVGLLIIYGFYGFCSGVLNGQHSYLPTDVLFWLAVLVSYYSLPPVFNIGYGVNVGDWVRRFYAISLVAILAFGYLSGGTAWSSTVGLLVYGLVIFVFVQLGPSFLVSGVLAVPG